jgi:2-polyprenyl-6-hydroxyphenyl methylase/3-demethylubiquinone-9 3-methyltransferase
MTHENVDRAEVAKFDALAARWWDPDGEFRPLHEINPLRLDWIRNFVDLSGKRALDVGCGGGILTESMAACGAQVSGIDMAEAPLAVAKLHQLESGAVVDYERTTAEELAQREAGQFDIVTCLEMLEHVPSPGCRRARTSTRNSSGRPNWKAGLAKQVWSCNAASACTTTP